MSSPPTAPRGVGHLRGAEPFPAAARRALADAQLRRNLAAATSTIRAKRAAVAAELPDWEALREAGRAIKASAMADLADWLELLEQRVAARGGVVHWARDSREANRIVTGLVTAAGAREVVKVKSIATDEIGLNDALASAGIRAHETDLAELIVQLGHDRPSHILVPAIHRNRGQIRDIFLREMPGVDPGLTDDPPALTAAARAYLRERFLAAKVAISGANFAVAETGTLAVVESEGNGRMCLTLPQTLITVMGIEKVIPSWRDLEVFLQLLPRSSTGERMNPYTSMWTGVTPGDGPRAIHLVLLDNGRTAALSDPRGREALHCIRCSACLNVCPVYERVGGHAYGSVYPGPIGAVLSPQLTGIEDNASLPYASSLCGACYQVCPVKIDIPSMLVHLRARHVEEARAARRLPGPEAVAMAAAAWVMASPGRFAAAQRVGRVGRALGKGGRIGRLPPPLAAWTAARDAPVPPRETFREWWARERGQVDGDRTRRQQEPREQEPRQQEPRQQGPEQREPSQREPSQREPSQREPGQRTADAAGAAGPAGASGAAFSPAPGAGEKQMPVSARGEMLGRIIRAAASADLPGPGSGGPSPGGPGPSGPEPSGPGPSGPGPSGPPSGGREPSGRASDSIPRDYRTGSDRSGAELLDLLAERLRDYRCLVRRVRPGEVAAAIGAALAERGARRVVVPSDLDLGEFTLGGALLEVPGSAELVPDDGLSPHALDAMDGVLTTAALAIAETGTIVLDGGPGQGRRVLTLIPDYHLCVLAAGRVVGLVPEAVARLRPDRPLTWISGPSATSDIELSRVEGVHGPRTLEVILVEPASP